MNHRAKKNMSLEKRVSRLEKKFNMHKGTERHGSLENRVKRLERMAHKKRRHH